MSTKNRYRMFLRGTVYWIQDNETGKQQTLRTKDRTEAERLLSAKNEAHRQPIINLQIGRAYLMVGDPEAVTARKSMLLQLQRIRSVMETTTIPSK